MELVIAHLSGALGTLGAVLLFPGYLFRRIRQLAISRAQLDKERIKVYAQFYLKYAPAVEHSCGTPGRKPCYAHKGMERLSSSLSLGCVAVCMCIQSPLQLWGR